MAASKQDVESWVNEGKRTKGCTHVLIVCDTYDWEDYSVLVLEGQDVHKITAENNGHNMTKLMEVYSMKMDIKKQLGEHRAFNY